MQWLWAYNHDRPNTGIRGITPATKLAMPTQVLRTQPVKNGGLPKPGSEHFYSWIRERV